MEKLVLPVLIALHTGFMEMLSPPEVHIVHLIRSLDILAIGLRFCGFRTETAECQKLYYPTNAHNVKT